MFDNCKCTHCILFFFQDACIEDPIVLVTRSIDTETQPINASKDANITNGWLRLVAAHDSEDDIEIEVPQQKGNALNEALLLASAGSDPAVSAMRGVQQRITKTIAAQVFMCVTQCIHTRTPHIIGITITYI